MLCGSRENPVQQQRNVGLVKASAHHHGNMESITKGRGLVARSTYYAAIRKEQHELEKVCLVATESWERAPVTGTGRGSVPGVAHSPDALVLRGVGRGSGAFRRSPLHWHPIQPASSCCR